MISAQAKHPAPHAVAPQTPGMQPLPIQPVKSTPHPIIHAAPPQPTITQPIQKPQPVIAKTTPLKSHQGKLAVQLGTFGQIKNAKALAHQLRHKHFHAFIRSIPASGHHAKLFKVLVGPEKTKHHAQQTMAKLYHTVHLHGMIIALKKQA
jgi:DedD protein